MYGQKSHMAAAPVLAATGLNFSWQIFGAMTLIFLGIAMMQLVRKPGKDRP